MRNRTKAPEKYSCWLDYCERSDDQNARLTLQKVKDHFGDNWMRFTSITDALRQDGNSVYLNEYARQAAEYEEKHTVTLHIDHQCNDFGDNEYAYIRVAKAGKNTGFHDSELIVAVISLDDIGSGEALEHEILFDLLENSMLDDIVTEMRQELKDIAATMLQRKLIEHGLRQLQHLKDQI